MMKMKMKMIEKEPLEKNRFTEEEYKKKVKEQFRQMLEDDSKKEQELIMKKLRKKQNGNLRKLKKAVEIKKEVDEFVKKLKEQEQ